MPRRFTSLVFLLLVIIGAVVFSSANDSFGGSSAITTQPGVRAPSTPVPVVRTQAPSTQQAPALMRNQSQSPVPSGVRNVSSPAPGSQGSGSMTRTGGGSTGQAAPAGQVGSAAPAQSSSQIKSSVQAVQAAPTSSNTGKAQGSVSSTGAAGSTKGGSGGTVTPVLQKSIAPASVDRTSAGQAKSLETTKSASGASSGKVESVTGGQRGSNSSADSAPAPGRSGSAPESNLMFMMAPTTASPSPSVSEAKPQTSGQASAQPQTTANRSTSTTGEAAVGSPKGAAPTGTADSGVSPRRSPEPEPAMASKSISDTRSQQTTIPASSAVSTQTRETASPSVAPFEGRPQSSREAPAPAQPSASLSGSSSGQTERVGQKSSVLPSALGSSIDSRGSPEPEPAIAPRPLIDNKPSQASGVSSVVSPQSQETTGQASIRAGPGTDQEKSPKQATVSSSPLTIEQSPTESKTLSSTKAKAVSEPEAALSPAAAPSVTSLASTGHAEALEYSPGASTTTIPYGLQAIAVQNFLGSEFYRQGTGLITTSYTQGALGTWSSAMGTTGRRLKLLSILLGGEESESEEESEQLTIGTEGEDPLSFTSLSRAAGDFRRGSFLMERPEVEARRRLSGGGVRITGRR